VLTVLGSLIGAQLLVATFAAEQAGVAWQKRYAAPALAVCAGATSGFSGTSGPLKGIALCSLKFDRLRFAGAASAVSLLGDVAKSAVFAGAGLLNRDAWLLVLTAAPMMPLAAFAGRRLNSKIGSGCMPPSSRACCGLFSRVALNLGHGKEAVPQRRDG
jgi:hypothetical protein